MELKPQASKSTSESYSEYAVKNSELPDGDDRKKYKYRVVFQGNRVVDQNMDEAQFQDLGSAPATVEASRLCILKGLLPGNKIEQADAMQAYIQAELGVRRLG